MPLGSWHRCEWLQQHHLGMHCVGTHRSQETLLWENGSLELKSWQRRVSCIDLPPVGVVMVDETKMLPKVPSMTCSVSSPLFCW